MFAFEVTFKASLPFVVLALRVLDNGQLDPSPLLRESYTRLRRIEKTAY
jgi:hypothetical protein